MGNMAIPSLKYYSERTTQQQEQGTYIFHSSGGANVLSTQHIFNSLIDMAENFFILHSTVFRVPFHPRGGCFLGDRARGGGGGFKGRKTDEG